MAVRCHGSWHGCSLYTDTCLLLQVQEVLRHETLSKSKYQSHRGSASLRLRLVKARKGLLRRSNVLGLQHELLL